MSWLKRLLGGAGRESAAVPEARLQAAYERLIEGIDPRLKGVARMRAPGRKALAALLGHADAVIARLPGPVELSARAWSGDRLLRALFASVDDLRRAVSASREVRAFLGRPGQDSAVALFGATLSRRAGFGSELKGDTIQREVAQTFVSFTEPRLSFPCASRDELLLALEGAVVDYFAARALEVITGARMRKSDLEREQAMLKTRLALLRGRRAGIDDALAAPAAPADERARIEGQLAENTRALLEAAASTATLEASGKLVREALRELGDFLSARQVRLALDAMNVEVREGDPDVYAALDLTEFLLVDRPPRVAMMARVLREDLLPERSLGDPTLDHMI